MTIIFPLEKRQFIRGCAQHKAAGLGCAVDYAANYVPLYAPVAGLVYLFNEAKGGNWIGIQDESGRKWEMAHLSERMVQSGQHVTAGQRIGTTGNTGTETTGPHLHLQVIVGYPNRVDPEPLLANVPLANTHMIDVSPYENKLVRIGVTPLRYGYVLRGKKHEYAPAQLDVLMALDKQRALTAVRIDPAQWDQIPDSVGLNF